MRTGGEIEGKEMENKLQSKKLEARTAEAKPDAEAKDKHHKQSLKPSEVPNIRDTESYMGSEWCGIFEVDVDFKQEHFLRAMKNLIKNPNINSTVILRSDTLKKI
ncbi:trna um 2 -o-methyltransferase [Brettanomyces bruxellensis AWRI1499]|nr:trna um 2 -o-methyltransferase [Brettanomyces bruxellensis AWRI1499]